jgi:hypothetical protein
MDYRLIVFFVDDSENVPPELVAKAKEMALKQIEIEKAEERLELIATLRRGYCLHERRVNICAECLAVLWQSYDLMHPEWRSGQSLFNAIESLRPDLADKIRSTTSDPFYSNESISTCLVWLAERLN